MKRYDDWVPRLIAYLSECHRTPYQPGRHDCALFAAGAVNAMCEVDPAAPYRGRYRSIRGGLRVLRRAGFVDHVAMTADVLPEIPVAMARVGDIIVTDGDDGPAMGVVQGERVYVLTQRGIGTIDLLQAKRAFRVGE